MKAPTNKPVESASESSDSKSSEEKSSDDISKSDDDKSSDDKNSEDKSDDDVSTKGESGASKHFNNMFMIATVAAVGASILSGN